MAGKWHLTRVGEFAPFAYGKGLSQGKRNESGNVPVFGSNGIIGYHDTALTNFPAVIIGRKGTVGAVHYSPVPSWPIDTAFFVAGNDPTLIRFKYYALRNLALENRNTDSAVPGLNRDAAHALELQIPDEYEQRAIAYVLGTLDDKIELNRRMNATLEGMARALFQSWFVDFDPVRAKAALKTGGTTSATDGSLGWSMDRARAYLASMDPEIAVLFPDRFVDSVLGEIPVGWEVSTIGQEVDVVGGSTPSTKVSSFWNGAINWATPKDLASLNTPVLMDTSRKITESGLAKISSGLLSRGTVLLSSRAPIGYLAIADIPVAINQGFIAMKCQRRLPAIYVWLWTAANMGAILENANGSTFQEISKRNFRPLPVIVPCESIRQNYNQLIQPLYNRIVLNERQSRALATLRDILLPKLISGGLQVDCSMASGVVL